MACAYMRCLEVSETGTSGDRKLFVLPGLSIRLAQAFPSWQCCLPQNACVFVTYEFVMGFRVWTSVL